MDQEQDEPRDDAASAVTSASVASAFTGRQRQFTSTQSKPQPQPQPQSILSSNRQTSSSSSLTSSLTSDGHPSLAINMNMMGTSISTPAYATANSASLLSTTRHPSTSSDIYDAARVTNWPRTKALAISQPHHASYTCADGFTALHHACTRRCPLPSVIAALIQAYPEALIEKDITKGWTPLHHACRFKCNKDGIHLLLQTIPEYGHYAAKVRDRERGRTPLYYAIRYDAPEGVVELLLSQMNCMDILDCDRDGMSALGLVWDRWVVSFEGKRHMGIYVKIVERWKKMYSDCGEDAEAKQKAWQVILEDSVKLRERLTGKLKGNWEKANKILRGAFKFDLQDDDCKAEEGSTTSAAASISKQRKWRILHAAVAIKCHPSLFMMAAVLHPEQMHELDRNDLFAGDEHSQSRSNIQPLSISIGNNSVNPGMNIQSALHWAAKAPASGSESKMILHHLLLFYPEAAKLKNPKDGSLPLHYLCANESKQHWVHDGIRSVYEAYKEAAVDQDLDGRTPLHRAATLHESTLYFVPPPSTFVGSPMRSRSSPPWDESTGSIVPNTPIRSSSATASGTRSSSSTERNSDTRIASVEDPVGSIIQNILTAHQEVAAIPDVTGKLLMHSIAECAENWDWNVQAVYDAYPEALSRREIVTRSLPLHLVSSNLDAKLQLVQKIVEYHPRAASLTNGDGRLPLHLACESGKSWYGGTEDIYKAFENAIQIAEDTLRRWMPLHFAASSPYSTMEFIEKIIGLAPDVAHAPDNLGCTPFYLAVESGKDWERGGLESLFQANPDAIDLPDANGKIPLVAALLAFCQDDGVTTSPDVDGGTNATLIQESLQPVDEYTTITHASIDDVKARGCHVLENDSTQINVLYHLLRAAPQVLTPRDY